MRPADPPDPSRVAVLVLDGHWGHTLHVVRALGMTGRWRVHVFAPAAPLEAPIHRSRHVSSFHQSRFSAADPDLIADIVARARAVGARVILPVREDTSLACIHHRARLEEIAHLPPQPDAATFSAAIDKGSLSEVLARHDVPHPKTYVHAQGEPLPASLPGFVWPLIVKPSRGEFGIGVSRAEDAPGLARAMETLGVSARFVVQECIAGEDIDCSILARDGRILAWTIQEGLIAATREFAPSSSIRFVRQAEVLAVAEKLARALSWSGIAHIDMRRDAVTGRILVLEINARFWGSLLGSVAAGVNFPDLACRAALGQAVPAPEQRDCSFTTHGHGVGQYLRHLTGRPGGFPYAETNLPFVLNDPLPTIAQELALRSRRNEDRPRRRSDGVAKVAGWLFLGLQLALIAYARFVPERYFCWAPYDEQTRYTISVVIAGRELSTEELWQRYRIEPDGWDARAAANILSIVRRYETTYGRDDGAAVNVRYQRNGWPQKVWRFPPPPGNGDV